MATDYTMLEPELIQSKANLKRDLHMLEVRRLSKKQADLAKSVVQRKQIANLTKIVAEIEPTVSTLYNPQSAVADNDIMGYLVYLLKMKDFYGREVNTKQEMINQRNIQIKEILRKLCAVTNESAKLGKSMPKVSPEFVRLENISNRMNNMNKRISTMRQENKEIMENIMNLRKFQGQFKKFERDFLGRIHELKVRGKAYLKDAVSAYEEKEEFLAKRNIFQNRCAQELRKAEINENALNVCIEKSEKNEAFAKLQDIDRTDIRIAETGDMIEKGITGLEPNLSDMQELQSAISEAAGEEEPEKMEESFKLADNKTASLFSYLDELFRDIHNLDDSVKQLTEENRRLIRGMSSNDRKMRKEIDANQDEAKKKLEEAENSANLVEDAQQTLTSHLDVVKSLYGKVCPDDLQSMEDKPLDDKNVMDYLQNMENQILDYLICVEYIRMKEASTDDPSHIVLETDEDADDSHSKKRVLPHIIRPRKLESDTKLQSLMSLETRKSVLEFEELKEQAMAVISGDESSDESTEEEDEEIPEKK